MLTRPPSLRAVAAFEAAARHGSFVKAAAELHLTQSAISHAISSLEARVGAQLFRKHGRTVALTTEGVRFATRVRASLGLLAEAFGGAPIGTAHGLIVGVNPLLGARLLAPRLSAFRALEPDLRLDLRAPGSVCAPEADCDVRVRMGPRRDLHAASRELAAEQLIAVASPGLAPHVDLDRAPNLIESREHPWTLWPVRTVGEGAAAATVDSSHTAIELARAGLGVCLAPSRLVEHDIAAGALVAVSDLRPPAEVAYFADWNPASERQNEIALFVAWLGAELSGASAGCGREALGRHPRPRLPVSS